MPYRLWPALLTLIAALTGQHLAAQERHGGPITDITNLVLEDGAKVYASTGFDGRVLIWSETFEMVTEEIHAPFPLEKVSVSKDCSTSPCQDVVIASPSDDGKFLFRKAFGLAGMFEIDRQGHPFWNGKPLQGGVNSILDVDHESSDLLLITRQEALALNVEDHEQKELPRAGINTLSGRLLGGRKALLGSSNGQLSLVDLQSRTLLDQAHAHDAPILAIDRSEDGKLAITAGANGTLSAWRIEESSIIIDRIIAQYQFPVLAIELDEANQRVLIGHKNGHLEAVSLLGEEGLSAPPRPAVLFAKDGEQDAQNTDPGAKLFRACAACHSFEPDGGNKAGPTFAALFGRRAGTVENYPYSQALINSDVIWSEDTLSALFELGPEHYLPGTTMPLQRLPDDEKRALLIGYIKAQARLSEGGKEP